MARPVLHGPRPAEQIIIGGLSNISGSAADDGLQRPLAIGERLCVLRKPGLNHAILPYGLGVAE
jgi:hypothetical protein